MAPSRTLARRNGSSPTSMTCPPAGDPSPSPSIPRHLRINSDESVPSTSRPSLACARWKRGSCRARQSGPTRPGFSDRGRARLGSRTRSPSRTASRVSSIGGWKSRDLCTISGRQPVIDSSSATSRRRSPRPSTGGSKSSRPIPRRTHPPCWRRSSDGPIAGRLTRARRCASFRLSWADWTRGLASPRR